MAICTGMGVHNRGILLKPYIAGVFLGLIAACSRGHGDAGEDGSGLAFRSGGAWLASESTGRPFTAFGPRTHERNAGAPLARSETFLVRNPNAAYVVRVSANEFASPLVTLNGAAILRPSDFSAGTLVVERRITLLASNQLDVELRGKPGGRALLEIIGFDDDLPSIIAKVSPLPNAAGWSNTDVTVTFECDDATSGIATCPAPVGVSSEGAGQQIRGVVTDQAGNSNAAMVIVNLDKTPPAFVRSWPPATAVFGTDRQSIELEGAVRDRLSGVAESTVRDPQGVVSLPLPSFAVVRPLSTDLQQGTVSRDTPFQLEARDVAGNVALETFTVRYTLASTMLPTDPAATEVVGGVRTAIDRALVTFRPGTSRDRVHEVIGVSGGRVAGFLSSANIALAVYPSSGVHELMGLLAGLSSQGEVLDVAPVPLFSAQAFDNDSLSALERGAYDAIRLPEAERFILDAALPLSHLVGVAIMDSGLNPALGLNGEFAGMKFFDLCTADGQAAILGPPSDSSGHGTRLTGIIGAANNGSGNNGVVSGILPAVAFTINVLRGACSPGESDFDGSLIALAMDLIVSNQISGIDVVNMSFGLGSADPGTKRWLGSVFLPFVGSARGSEILWVASAGNNALETSCDGFLLFPAGLACTEGNVVSVAAYEPSSLLAASYSNFGPSVTVSAPGTVWTPAGVGSYGFAVGTSAAPPLVTGAAALLQALKPRNPLTVKQLLRNTARPLADNALPQGGLDVLQLILAGNLSPLPRDFSGGRLSGGQAFILVPDIGEVPGLAGFLLDYDDDDHHVGRLVAGTFEATPGRAFSTQVLVGYGDDGDDDSFQWAVDRQALPPGTTVHETRQCDVTGGLNWALGPLSGDRVPVLLGFHFLGTERHLKTVEARIMEVAFQSGPYLFAEAQFGDKNPDNRFCVSIAYGLVPADRVVARGELHGTDSGGYDSASFSGNQPVLQGFALEFVNDDHHLDQVGVRLDPRRASVWYNDKNDDDDFKWDIWWVDVR